MDELQEHTFIHTFAPVAVVVEAEGGRVEEGPVVESQRAADVAPGAPGIPMKLAAGPADVAPHVALGAANVAADRVPDLRLLKAATSQIASVEVVGMAVDAERAANVVCSVPGVPAKLVTGPADVAPHVVLGATNVVPDGVAMRAVVSVLLETPAPDLLAHMPSCLPDTLTDVPFCGARRPSDRPSERPFDRPRIGDRCAE